MGYLILRRPSLISEAAVFTSDLRNVARFNGDQPFSTLDDCAAIASGNVIYHTSVSRLFMMAPRTSLERLG